MSMALQFQNISESAATCQLCGVNSLCIEFFLSKLQLALSTLRQRFRPCSVKEKRRRKFFSRTPFNKNFSLLFLVPTPALCASFYFPPPPHSPPGVVRFCFTSAHRAPLSLDPIPLLSLNALGCIPQVTSQVIFSSFGRPVQRCLVEESVR